MMGGGARERPFELDDWLVDPARCVLQSRKTGKEARLEPRLMDLLLLFAASDGRVLGKDEIIANVWSGKAIGDDTLAAAVSRLRSALGETADARYIETVPKRGYRFARSLSDIAVQVKSPAGRADQLVQQGEAALQSPFPASLKQAQLYFSAAIAEEPSSARAQTGLAEALLAQHVAGEGSEALPLARNAALAATGLDKTFARAWSALGLCHLLIDRDFARADRALAHASGLDPTLASARRHRAFAFATVGHFTEAEREARKAVELESVSLASRNLLLQVLIAARRYKWVLAAANDVLQVAPQSAEAWYAKAWANIFLGDENASIDAVIQGLALWGLKPERLALLRMTFERDGFAAGSAAIADLFEEQGLLFRPRRTDIAILRASARQFDRAFEALEAALAIDDPYLLLLPWLPHFDPLRADARFSAFLGRVRLVH
jgi:DNA-binding winged helix-turn-helix (wHTH) protein